MKRLFGLLLLCSTFGAFAMEESVKEVEVKEETEFKGRQKLRFDDQLDRITEAFNRGELTRDLVKEILVEARYVDSSLVLGRVNKMEAELIAAVDAVAANPDATADEQENAKAAALLLDFLESPLMRAIKEGYSDVCMKLIEKGVDLDAQAKYGETVLMRAIKEGDSDLCIKLIEKGADYEN